MKEVVTLNRKEQWRLEALNKMERGELTAREASAVLEVSLRHVRRMVARYRNNGAEALAHGNRGRIPWNVRSPQERERAVALARTKYAGCNQQHMSELLAQREELQISRSALRRILLEAGIGAPRRRRPPKHRTRRERYPQEGMLLQIDGSLHRWLEERGPSLTLIGAIDDATGTVPYALFREHEDAQGYFLLLEHITRVEGRPLALYRDRHSIFEHSANGRMTIAERVNGKRDPTQFGRLLEELDIGSIAARSPQAKGRVERLWGTFQDRLVSELRLAGASTLQEANQALWDFLPRYSKRFAVPPAVSGSASAHSISLIRRRSCSVSSTSARWPPTTRRNWASIACSSFLVRTASATRKPASRSRNAWTVVWRCTTAVRRSSLKWRHLRPQSFGHGADGSGSRSCPLGSRSRGRSPGMRSESGLGRPQLRPAKPIPGGGSLNNTTDRHPKRSACPPGLSSPYYQAHRKLENQGGGQNR